jgi:hypothetical protein
VLRTWEDTLTVNDRRADLREDEGTLEVPFFVTHGREALPLHVEVPWPPPHEPVVTFDVILERDPNGVEVVSVLRDDAGDMTGAVREHWQAPETVIDLLRRDPSLGRASTASPRVTVSNNDGTASPEVEVETDGG